MPKRIFAATGILAVVGGTATAVAVSSCETECTLEARPAVVVHVVNAAGSTAFPTAPDGVWYTVAEDPIPGGPDPVAQTPIKGICSDAACSTWLLGFEQPGQYVVHTSICGEVYTNTVTVMMTADDCHVDTVDLHVMVDESACEGPGDSPPTPPPTCSTEARPSVIATTVHADGPEIPVSAQEVNYLWEHETPLRNAACINEDCSQWAIGWELEGEYVINAEACGDSTSVTVDVGRTADGCHVETEYVSIPLDADRCKPDVIQLPPGACNPVPVPAVQVYVAEDGGDVYMPVAADEVRWKYDGHTGTGACMDAPKCANWSVPVDYAGRFEIEADVCGKTLTTEVDVEATADGCHPVTEFVTILTETEGCTVASHDQEPPPAPTGRRGMDKVKNLDDNSPTDYAPPAP